MNNHNAIQEQGHTILVVDDSHENLIVLVAGLESRGYEVLVATDGEEALERARLTEPDLILLDVMMPGLDGFEVCRRLKSDARTRNVPVIFMTSLSQVEDKKKGFGVGAVDYITKPLHFSEVSARVSSHIRLSALQKQLKEKNEKLEFELARRNEIENTLRKSENVLTEAQRIAKLGSWELEISRNVLTWSDEIFRIFEIDPEKFSATYEAFLNAIHPDDRDLVNQAYTDSLANHQPYSVEHRLLMEDGRIKYVHEHCETQYDVNGNPLFSIGTVQDITERKLTRDALYQQEQELRALVENSPDTIARYDRQLRIIYANPAFVRLSGFPLDDLIGNTTGICVHDPLQAAAFEQRLVEVFEKGEGDDFELTLSVDGGAIINYIRIVPEVNKQGDIVSALAVGRDITQIEEYRQKIHELAFYDPLTGLPNRSLFLERLKQEMINAKRHGYVTCLMLLDLDHFKVVNDTLGHPAGDQLLQTLGNRLKNLVRDYDTVARLGGDEFALLFPEIRQKYDVVTIANKIMAEFSIPFMINGRELFLTPCIGISLYPQDCEDADELLKNADSALYHAKGQGRNCYRSYNLDMTAQAKERFELEASLRKAVENGELELFFQSQNDLNTGCLVGAEVLLRWRHPEHGLLTPEKFIGIAEETGLIVSIGEWVLREACNVVTKWNRHGQEIVRVAVNVSTRQFRMNDFSGTVRTILSETGCRPEWLELEITESLLLVDSDEIRMSLEDLHELGIHLAIDDFGTGYSALSYLNRFPIRVLKIDRSFINDIAIDPHSASLVKAIIAMAYSLKLKLVAEGIENVQQDELLRTWGCHTAQGYLYGRPIPLVEFERILTTERGEDSCREKVCFLPT